MKRTRRNLVVLVCLVVAAGLLGPAAARATVTPAKALAELNAWRAEAGVPPVTGMRDDWNAGCAAHLRYVGANGPSGHAEDPNAAGYTPEGHEAAASSVLAYRANEGVRISWLHAVYHRADVLHPRLRVSGWASSRHGACLRIGGGTDDSPAARAPQLTLHPWPPDGAVDQPTRFVGGENPSPSDDAGGDRTLGFLLSVGVNGPWSHVAAPQTEVHSAQLVDGRARNVAIAVSDHRAPNGSGMNGGFAIIPRGPLAYGRWYTATAAGTVLAEGVAYPFTYSWRFRTTTDRRCDQLPRRLARLASRGRALARVQRREHRILRRMHAAARRAGWPANGRRSYVRRLAAYHRRGRRFKATYRAYKAARADHKRLRCA
jgi:hypothetical protein